MQRRKYGVSPNFLVECSRVCSQEVVVVYVAHNRSIIRL